MANFRRRIFGGLARSFRFAMAPKLSVSFRVIGAAPSATCDADVITVGNSSSRLAVRDRTCRLGRKSRLSSALYSSSDGWAVTVVVRNDRLMKGSEPENALTTAEW